MPDNIRLLKDFLNYLGVPFHQAPAEAAPTCVTLHQLGLVDAVRTNHSAALAWKCRDIVLFKMQHRHRRGGKMIEEVVTKYDAVTLLHQWDFDPSSLVLGLLLGGCE